LQQAIDNNLDVAARVMGATQDPEIERVRGHLRRLFQRAAIMASERALADDVEGEAAMNRFLTIPIRELSVGDIGMVEALLRTTFVSGLRVIGDVLCSKPGDLALEPLDV
jgi:hypothetical protein